MNKESSAPRTQLERTEELVDEVPKTLHDYVINPTHSSNQREKVRYYRSHPRRSNRTIYNPDRLTYDRDGNAKYNALSNKIGKNND